MPVLALAQPAPAFRAPWLAFSTGLAATDGAPVALAAGDVDGDGDVDVVAARAVAQGGFVLLRNDGSGRFAAPVSAAGAGSAADVVLADLDGDGDLDAAVTDSDALTTGSTVSVYLNTGGTFGTRRAVSVGAGAVPVGLVALDADGDGDLDLAVAAYGSVGGGSTVRLLRNTGDATFAAAASFPAGPSPYDLAAGDLTGDGRPDLAVANGGSGFSVLRNDGAGGFAAPVSYAVTASTTTQTVALGDADGDGDLDAFVAAVASTGDRVVAQFRNGGTGTFTRGTDVPAGTSVTSITAADLTGDGRAELLVANASARASDGVAVVPNDGAGGFGAAVLYPGGQSTPVAVAADLDGDGDRDLLTADDFSRAVTVRLNTGGGTFPVTSDDYAGFVQTFQDAADADGDGDLDVFTSGPHPSASTGAVMRNDGTGRFPSRTQITNGTEGVAAGVLRDLNGDGRPDLLFNNANTAPQSDFFTAMNTGTGTFGAVTRHVVRSAGWGEIDAVDLDGDGDLDVVDMEALGAPGIPDGEFFVAMNNGDGTFQPATVYDRLPARPEDVVAGDFDEDGRLDLAMTAPGSFGFDARVMLVRGRGDGTFDAPTVYTVGRGPLYIVTADFDRDGHLDLATINTGYDDGGGSTVGAESLTVLFGTGTGAFTRLRTLYAPFSPDLLGATGIAAGDVDADGDLDLMTTGVSNDVALYINDGAGTFSFPLRLGAVAGTHFPLFADFTGDGRPDLAVLSAAPPLGFDSGIAVLTGLTTAPTAGEPAAPVAMTSRTGLAVAPNPANTRTAVTLTLDAAQTATVAVYDALGRRVALLHDGSLGAGTHAFALDASELAPGLYVVRTTGAGLSASHRLVVAR